MRNKSASVMSGLLLVGLMAAVACGDGGKAAADTAMQALQSSYEAVKSDASKYVPDQAKSLDAAFTAVQDTLAKGEYTKALEEVKGLTSQVSEIGSAVSAKKAELTKTFEGLSAGMPGVVQSLQTQVDTLAKARKLPEGVTKDAVEAAKAAVPELSASWDEAAAAFKSANLTDAMAKAQAVRSKASQLMASIGMSVPDALK